MLNSEGRSHKLITLMLDASHVVSCSLCSNSISIIIPCVDGEIHLSSVAEPALRGRGVQSCLAAKCEPISPHRKASSSLSSRGQSVALNATLEGRIKSPQR